MRLRMQHEGDLFRSDNTDLIAVNELAARLPATGTPYRARPTIVAEVKNAAMTLTSNFSVSNQALLNLSIDSEQPIATVPCELPASIAGAANQKNSMCRMTPFCSHIRPYPALPSDCCKRDGA